VAKYRVLRKFFDGQFLHEPGAVIDFNGLASPDILAPVGPGPHNVAPRRNDLPGTRFVSFEKRAEIAATEKPMSRRELIGDTAYLNELEEKLREKKEAD